MKPPVIQSTTDYKQFKLIDFNREKRRWHIDKMKKRIEKENLLHVHPILINLEDEVVDGQHRLAAAEELELPVFYIKENISYDHILNSNIGQEKLTLEDVIRFYAIKDRIPDYIQFQDYIKRLNLSCKAFIGLIFGGVSMPILEFIKDGKFRMPQDKILITSLVDLYQDFMTFVVARRLTPYALFTSTKFTVGLRNLAMLYGFDHDIFFKKLEQKWYDLRPQHNAKDWTRHLVDIYNHNSRSHVLQLPEEK